MASGSSPARRRYAIARASACRSARREWLAAHSGDANLLARVGSNHFAAVVPRIGSRADLSALIEGSLDALGNHAFDVQGGRLRISGKVGGAVFPDGGSSAEALFRNAEAALKHGKANGDRYLLHSSEMTDAVAGKLGLEARLRRALDEGEFVLHYQPKVDLASGRVTSAEALIRWNDPLDGLVQPGDFIPVLEDTGLIGDDFVHLHLERVAELGNRGVHDQVNNQVSAENDARQRVQPPQQEVPRTADCMCRVVRSRCRGHEISPFDPEVGAIIGAGP